MVRTAPLDEVRVNESINILNLCSDKFEVSLEGKDTPISLTDIEFEVLKWVIKKEEAFKNTFKSALKDHKLALISLFEKDLVTI